MEQQGSQSFPVPPPSGPIPLDPPLLPARPDWRLDLRRAVLNRVVPRLSAVGRDGGRASPSAGVPDEAEVARFAELALLTDLSALLGRVDALRAAGQSAEAVVTGLMAPAARYLGDLWLADRLGFVDVTVGLGRLQALLRALGPDLEGGGPERSGGGRILLAAVPGEQHVFGLSVVAAFFRRAGWDVVFEPRAALDDLLALVRASRFAAVGLSVASDRFLPSLPDQARALRDASLAPDVVMLAGGPALAAAPDLHGCVDAVPCDAAEAVRVARSLTERPAAPRA